MKKVSIEFTENELEKLFDIVSLAHNYCKRDYFNSHVQQPIKDCKRFKTVISNAQREFDQERVWNG